LQDGVIRAAVTHTQSWNFPCYINAFSIPDGDLSYVLTGVI